VIRREKRTSTKKRARITKTLKARGEKTEKENLKGRRRMSPKAAIPQEDGNRGKKACRGWKY